MGADASADTVVEGLGTRALVEAVYEGLGAAASGEPPADEAGAVTPMDGGAVRGPAEDGFSEAAGDVASRARSAAESEAQPVVARVKHSARSTVRCGRMHRGRRRRQGGSR